MYTPSALLNGTIKKLTQEKGDFVVSTFLEGAEALAKATRSEVVQVIGTKFVLYRQSHNKEKKDKIVLVQDRKKKPLG